MDHLFVGARSRRGYALMLALCAGAALQGCDTSKPMRLETTFKLDGPIQMQMQMMAPSMRYDGTFVSEPLFDQVKVGTTTRDWLVAAFGEPDRTSTLPDNSEYLVWAYRLAAVKGEGINVLSVDTKKSNEPAQVTTIVHVVNGIVREKWRG